MSLRRRGLTGLGLAAACASGALAVAACGASNSVKNTIDPVAQAAVISNAASGYRMTLTMQINSPALPTPIDATGGGSFDVGGHTGSLSLTVNLGSIPELTQVLGASSLQLEELIQGSTVYIKLPPALMSKIPGLSKPWLKINLSQAGSAAGIPGLSAIISNPAASDPSQLLRYLRETSGSVTKVGTATVDGRQTTHYRAKVSLDRVPDAFPAASRPQVRQAIASLERTTHAHLLPVDVWIDGSHLVRRLQLALGETVSGQPLNAMLAVDIPQYGQQPPPAIPPADEVEDVSGLGNVLG
jgi:hypothetical protein